MGLCAHRKSDYRLHKLPKCPKCKQEFILVLAAYEEYSEEEWECSKCGKHIPRWKIKEAPISKQDEWLMNWCKNEQRRAQRRENNSYCRKIS